MVEASEFAFARGGEIGSRSSSFTSQRQVSALAWPLKYAGRRPKGEFEPSLSPSSKPRRIDKVATSSYFRLMRSVGIKLLKNKLSEYIRLAASGETVLVTDRDRVVAELGPPAPDRSPVVSDALLLDAVRQGWIRPPLLVARTSPERKPVMKLGELLRDLQQDRADR